MESSHVSLPLLASEVVHRFSSTWCSKGIELSNNNSTVTRNRNSLSGLVFASTPLWHTSDDEVFEIRLEEVQRQWAGSLRFGVATQVPMTHGEQQAKLKDLESLNGDLYWLEGSCIMHNGAVFKMNYTKTTLDRLVVGDKLAVKRSGADGSLRFLINDDNCGVGVPNMPKKLIPFVELNGSTMCISVTSMSQTAHPSPAGSLLMHNRLPSMNTMMDSLEVVLEEEKSERESGSNELMFHDHHGRNIQVRNGGKSASRTDSYNQGVLLTHRPLKDNEMFEVSVDKLSNRWTSSLMIGALFEAPEKIHLPVTALGFKKNAIVISGDTLYQNGLKTDSVVVGSFNLDQLETGQKVGILVDGMRNLKLSVNGVDLGVIVKNIPQPCYGILDLYGQCEEVSIVLGESNQDFVQASITNQESKNNSPLVLRPQQASSETCDYLSLCSRFKSSLSIPSHFMSGLEGLCCCANCVKYRGEDMYKKKGDPPKDFATPVHWVRFPLKRVKAEQASTEAWHTTYHGTKASILRKILDHGELFPVLDFGLMHKMTTKPKESKEDDSDAPQLVFSPTLSYFLRSAQGCVPCYFEDNGKRYRARLAFEVDIHPGSYKIGPPSTSVTSVIDAHFKLDETEWLTKEKGNTAIKALLVHLEPS